MLEQLEPSSKFRKSIQKNKATQVIHKGGFFFKL
jgi:hypothetical protein